MVTILRRIFRGFMTLFVPLCIAVALAAIAIWLGTHFPYVLAIIIALVIFYFIGFVIERSPYMSDSYE